MHSKLVLAHLYLTQQATWHLENWKRNDKSVVYLLSQFLHTQVNCFPDVWLRFGPHSLVPPSLLVIQRELSQGCRLVTVTEDSSSGSACRGGRGKGWDSGHFAEERSGFCRS